MTRSKLICVCIAGAFAVPASGASVTAIADTGPVAHAADSKAKAAHECREERREHPRQYRKRFGTGTKAMNKCIAVERRDHDGEDDD